MQYEFARSDLDELFQRISNESLKRSPYNTTIKLEFPIEEYIGALQVNDEYK